VVVNVGENRNWQHLVDALPLEPSSVVVAASAELVELSLCGVATAPSEARLRTFLIEGRAKRVK